MGTNYGGHIINLKTNLYMETIKEQIKQLRNEIIELKTNSPYNPIIKKKILALDSLIEISRSGEC